MAVTVALVLIFVVVDVDVVVVVIVIAAGCDNQRSTRARYRECSIDWTNAIKAHISELIPNIITTTVSSAFPFATTSTVPSLPPTASSFAFAQKRGKDIPTSSGNEDLIDKWNYFQQLLQWMYNEGELQTIFVVVVVVLFCWKVLVFSNMLTHAMLPPHSFTLQTNS